MGSGQLQRRTRRQLNFLGANPNCFNDLILNLALQCLAGRWLRLTPAVDNNNRLHPFNFTRYPIRVLLNLVAINVIGILASMIILNLVQDL